ncbi:MAG: histidine phosphatase family protein, partial [Planctomycetales bacterium]|nr:histidine phosphatase family protein [Planctomycetales bacterium]
MKLLTLLRHAKSDWGDPGLSDFDRPLNERGRKDAPAVGSFFERAGLTPDLIVSSPARRARQTCDLFAQEAGYKKRISWEESIYAASSEA